MHFRMEVSAMTDVHARLSKLAYGLDEVAELTGLGKSTLYIEARQGRLKLAKVGKRSIVLAEDLTSFLSGLRAGLSARTSPTGSPKIVGARRSTSELGKIA
jgi:excisionase family DNA binding protein